MTVLTLKDVPQGQDAPFKALKATLERPKTRRKAKGGAWPFLAGFLMGGLAASLGLGYLLWVTTISYRSSMFAGHMVRITKGGVTIGARQ